MSEEKQIEDMLEAQCAFYGECEHCPVYPNDKGQEDKCRTGCRMLYEAGYRKQSEPISCAHEKGGEWISVEWRLPDNYGPVLVACEGTTIGGAAPIAIGSYGGGFWSLADADGTCYLTKYMHVVVTHWMPLPEAPKKGGGE